MTRIAQAGLAIFFAVSHFPLMVRFWERILAFDDALRQGLSLFSLLLWTGALYWAFGHLFRALARDPEVGP